MNNNYYQKNVTEIDLIELVKYLLKKWKFFALVIILGAAAALAVNFVQVKNADAQMLSDYVENEFSEEDIHSFQTELVNQTVKYKTSLTSYDSIADERLALQMDASDVYTLRMTYLISADNYTIDAAGAYYRQLFATTESRQRIMKAIGDDCTESDIDDLLIVSYETLNNVITTDDGSATPATGELDICCYTVNEESAKAVEDTVKEIISAGEGSGPAPEAEVSFLSDSITYGYVSDIFDISYDYFSKREKYVESITNLEKSLSADEIYYVDYLSGEDYQIGETGKMNVIKYGVIGAFLGAVLLGVYYCCRFIFGKEIKNLGDIESLRAPRIIARYPENTKEYILSALEAVDGEKLLLSVDDVIEDREAWTSFAAAENARIIVSGSLDKNPDAIAKAKDANAIVLVVKIWKSSKNSLRQQLISAEGMGKKVEGIIVEE